MFKVYLSLIAKYLDCIQLSIRIKHIKHLYVGSPKLLWLTLSKDRMNIRFVILSNMNRYFSGLGKF